MKKNKFKLFIWLLFILFIFLIWPGKLIYPGSAIIGEKPYSEGKDGRWRLIGTETDLEYQFKAVSDRLKGITLNIRKQDEMPYGQYKGTIIVSIKDSYGKNIAVVNQSISQLHDNTLTFFELDAYLKKGEYYSLSINLENTSLETLSLFENKEGDSFVPGIQYNYLKSLEPIQIILLWMSCLILGGILFGEKYIPHYNQFVKSFLFLCILGTIGAWWYYYKFRPIVNNNKVLSRVFIVLISLIVLIFIIQLTLCYWKNEKKPHKLFLYSSFIWGIIYMIIFPAFTAPDEDTHFVSSYDLSSVMMGMDQLSENGKVLVRSIDNEIYVLSPGYELLENYYSKVIEKTEKWVYEESKSRNPYSTSRQTSVFNYLFQAIGLLIARVFNMNYFWLIILGRMFNLIAYIILMYVTIKIIPIGKWLIYVISQFPMVLELSASYSYDVINIGMVFLFIALVLNIKFNMKPIQIRDIVFISFIGVIMTMIKGMYFPLLFLVFIIPKEKFENDFLKKHSSIIRLCIVGIIIIVTFLVNNQMLTHISGTENISSAIIGHANARSIYSLIYDPVEMVRLFGNTIIKYGDSILFSIFGQKLAWRIDMLPLHLIACFIGIIVYTLGVNDKIFKSINLSDRIISLGIMIACAGLAAVAMLLVNTPVGSEVIEGVQGRYFLPFLPLLSLTAAYSNSKASEITTNVTRVVLGTSILNYIAILYIFAYILSN